MHQQKQDESKKDEGVCGPAEVIFVKDTFLKEQIDKKKDLIIGMILELKTVFTADWIAAKNL